MLSKTDLALSGRSVAALPESTANDAGWDSVDFVERFFNTTGPCKPEWHYMLPAEGRLPDLLPLIQRNQYFVLHAARQVGKTTAMMALAARLRTEGYAAVFLTLETSQAIDNLEHAEGLWISAIRDGADRELPSEQQPPITPADAAGSRLGAWLRAWAGQLAPVPLVLFFDEADVVQGVPLVNLLRQLRGGFPHRPERFPASIGLIGMRDLRDYLTAAKDGAAVNPGSPFNVKAASITIRNFNEEEVRQLYAQHTHDTGQVFTPDAVARAYWWTRGQPFLVNAIAAQCMDKLVTDRAVAITDKHIDEAKERLILSRTTHLDSLGVRLRDARVARVMAGVLSGAGDVQTGSDDFAYCVDLGLLSPKARPPEVACPLYREVIGRELSLQAQDNLILPRLTWLEPNGTLKAAVLVGTFLSWWRENSDFFVRNNPEGYAEAMVHIAFMAFLQKVVNGGGQVYREFAAGRGRVDLCVDLAGAKSVFELKRVRPDRDSPERIRREGIQQLSEYLDSLGMTEGWLIIFDQRPGISWDQRLWSEDVELDGKLLRLRGA